MKNLTRLFLAAAIGICSCQTLPDSEPEKPAGPSNPEPEQPEKEAFYKKVTQNREDWSGDFLITYSDNSTITVFDSWGEGNYGVSSSDLFGHLTSEGIPAEEGDKHKSIISKEGGHYAINVEGVGFIGFQGTKNALYKSTSRPSASDSEFLWDISFDNGRITLSCVSNAERRLQWNSNAPRFACYTGSQNELTLYVKGYGSGANPDPKPDPNPDPDPDPDPTPDPDPDPNPGPSDGGYGWYELPAMDTQVQDGYIRDSQNPQIWYAHHLCDGNEKGPGGKKARNYTVCYSAEHHCPLWVAAPRHKMYEGSANRTNAYATDPGIPSNIQYNSKTVGGGCNKGHMLGSAERTSSTATNRQVFYYSNIAPQEMSNFNTGGGGWNNLEDWVDNQVCQDTLYVVIGTYFETYTDRRGYTDSPKTISFGGRNDVTKPSMFYYVLMRTKSGNSGKALSQCKESEIKCAAFVRSHATPRGVSVSEKDMLSVSELEKITGLRYFTNVPQAPKSTYTASDWGL